MNLKYNFIHITGASGAGTTTLAKAISEKFGYTHLDSDNFFWEQTEIPYTVKTDIEKRQSLMMESIEKSEKIVLSGSLVDWGDMFIEKFNLVIYVYTKTDIRITRLQRRESENFGDRIQKNGDMYIEHQNFLKWAALYDDGDMEVRSSLLHKHWLEKVNCPIINISGELSTDENIKIIKNF